MPKTSRTSENQHACSLVMETIVKTTMAEREAYQAEQAAQAAIKAETLTPS